ncbi:hypothetical protein [Desulfuromonas thiophila]|uniref:Cell division protein FtsL n=1 Tax=Desulfuromonas thiophila TaxID=57664 RepID=A0A1G6YIY3_9BACT|nr:hypothetical protein [Desulfuromonas thiophila]SDD90338.1 cell division protein FtsL [Desulfuromonas thiophila]
MLDLTWSPLGISGVRPRVASVLGAIVVALAIGLFHVWLSMEVTRSQYEVSGLEKQIRQMRYDNKELEVAVARYSNPAHVRQQAMERLGLRVPAAHQVVTIQPETL